MKRGAWHHQKNLAINYRRKKEYDPGWFSFTEIYELEIEEYFAGGILRYPSLAVVYLFTTVHKAMEYAQSYADKRLSQDEWERDGSIHLIFTKTNEYQTINIYRCEIKGRFTFKISEAYIDRPNEIRHDVPFSGYPKLSDTWSQFFDED